MPADPSDTPAAPLTPSKLLLVTGNPGKLAEARRLWPGELDSVAIDLPEIQSNDIREVVTAKGAEALRHLKDHPLDAPVVVEETGLEIDAFGGFPGPLVKWMLEAMGAGGMEQAARLMARAGDRQLRGDDKPVVGATARCLLLLVDPASGRQLAAEGAVRGRLVTPRGEHGFGWDPIFRPDEQDGGDSTYAQMSDATKDAVGHRGKAWRGLVEKLGAGRGG